MDESLAEQQQKAYAIAGVDESEPAIKPKEKKRKNYTGEGEDADEVLTSVPLPAPSNFLILPRPKKKPKRRPSPKRSLRHLVKTPPSTSRTSLSIPPKPRSKISSPNTV